MLVVSHTLLPGEGDEVLESYGSEGVQTAADGAEEGVVGVEKEALQQTRVTT